MTKTPASVWDELFCLESRYARLFERYGVPPGGDISTLSLLIDAMARAHVPGFKIDRRRIKKTTMGWSDKQRNNAIYCCLVENYRLDEKLDTHASVFHLISQGKLFKELQTPYKTCSNRFRNGRDAFEKYHGKLDDPGKRDLIRTYAQSMTPRLLGRQYLSKKARSKGIPKNLLRIADQR